MKEFIKKQCVKIGLYIVILIVLSVIGYIFEINVSILANISSVITFIFVIILQKTWLEDYKSGLNTTLETHKAKLVGYTLVTKLQYELEFSIYKEIYGELMLIMSKMGKLSELISKGENNHLSTEKENWKKEKEKIDLKILQNQPFYSKEIANQITKIVGTFNAIVENIENINDANLTKNFTFVVMTTVEEIENLATLIRERIENMKIVE